MVDARTPGDKAKENGDDLSSLVEKFKIILIAYLGFNFAKNFSKIFRKIIKFFFPFGFKFLAAIFWPLPNSRPECTSYIGSLIEAKIWQLET